MFFIIFFVKHNENDHIQEMKAKRNTRNPPQPPQPPQLISLPSIPLRDPKTTKIFPTPLPDINEGLTVNPIMYYGRKFHYRSKASTKRKDSNGFPILDSNNKPMFARTTYYHCASSNCHASIVCYPDFNEFFYV